VFSVHLTDSVNTQINKLGTEVDIIPGGDTGAVQVLDKWVDTIFKVYLMEHFEEWMCTNGLRHRPSRVDVAQWATRACAQVRTSTIVNTWKCIGPTVSAITTFEDNILPANQPMAGQDNTTDDEDEENDDCVLHQMENEREAPAPLLQRNFGNDDDK
jgi:hypothetical protein